MPRPDRLAARFGRILAVVAAAVALLVLDVPPAGADHQPEVFRPVAFRDGGLVVACSEAAELELVAGLSRVVQDHDPVAVQGGLAAPDGWFRFPCEPGRPTAPIPVYGDGVLQPGTAWVGLVAGTAEPVWAAVPVEEPLDLLTRRAGPNELDVTVDPVALQTPGGPVVTGTVDCPGLRPDDELSIEVRVHQLVGPSWFPSLGVDVVVGPCDGPTPFAAPITTSAKQLLAGPTVAHLWSDHGISTEATVTLQGPTTPPYELPGFRSPTDQLSAWWGADDRLHLVVRVPPCPAGQTVWVRPLRFEPLVPALTVGDRVLSGWAARRFPDPVEVPCTGDEVAARLSIGTEHWDDVERVYAHVEVVPHEGAGTELYGRMAIK